MLKLVRMVFVFFAVLVPMMIGLLHSYVHFDELTIEAVKDMMSFEVSVLNKPSVAWNSWGLMSFMMGGSFVVIGLLNLSAFLRLKVNAFPPISNMLVMCFYLACVVYASMTFEAKPQLYGGAVGLIFMLVILVITLIQKSHPEKA